VSKEDVRLLQSHNSHFAFGRRLPFAFEMSLPSKGLCQPRAFGFKMALSFAIEGPLLALHVAIEGSLPSKGLCHGRAFTLEEPFP
jgi:hypothetical protein